MRTTFGLFILIFTLVAGFTVEARIDIKNTKRLVMPADVSEPLLTVETSRKILPKSVSASDSGSRVISKMVDNTISHLWDTSSIKQTSLGQAAEKVEKKMNAEVNLGQSANAKTEHKISVKLLAMEALARLEYKGWIRAGVSYDARAARTIAEVSESLAANQDVVISQSLTSEENKSQFSLRWNW